MHKIILISSITYWDIFLSFLRWGIGLTIGITIGMMLGLLGYYAGAKGKGYALMLNFFRAIPIIGLVPLIQITIGYGEIGKFMLIAWSTTFPVWLSVEHALKRQSLELELVLFSYQCSPIKRFKIYVFPRLLAGFVNGVQVSIGIGWLSVVAAELIGIYQDGFWAGGLGYLIMDAHNQNNWLDVLLGLGIFGFLGMITAKAWEFAFNLYFSSRKGFNPMFWIKHG